MRLRLILWYVESRFARLTLFAGGESRKSTSTSRTNKEVDWSSLKDRSGPLPPTQESRQSARARRDGGDSKGTKKTTATGQQKVSEANQRSATAPKQSNIFAALADDEED